MRWWAAISLGGGMAGCVAPPPEAPNKLGELGRFLFEHFEDEDVAALNAGLRNLADLLRDVDDELPAEERAVTMPRLDRAALGGLDLPEGADPQDQIAVAIAGRSRFPVEDQLRIATDPVQTCLESALTVWAGRDFLTDPSCFASGACTRLETLTAVRRELGIFVRLWYDQLKTYRYFSVPTEEGAFPVLAGRAWIEEPFEGDSGGTSMDQLFHLDVYLGDGDDTLRWFSMWSSVSGLVIGDDAYAQQVVAGLEEALQFSEEYLGGKASSCPHSREADKPPR